MRSANRRAFQLVSWKEEFLAAALDEALRGPEAALEDTLFIFPHLRPAAYLERLIRNRRDILKPCLLPRMLPINRLFQEIQRENLETGPLREASLLDQVGLLRECVRDEQRENPLEPNFPLEHAEAFFPWGVRLANLFEECFLHNRRPQAFMHLEDELPAFAAAVLSRLSALYQRYVQGLERLRWSTPGFTAQKAAAALEQGLRPRFFSGPAHIFICGFYGLTGTEEVLLKTLWREDGARVLLHADPAMLSGQEHWSCAELRGWVRHWQAALEALPVCAGRENSETEMDLYGGYDAHSQLATLQSTLDGVRNSSGDTAVILPDSSLLLPVLHHIDASDVNISMGYPLAGTPLNRFLENLLTLHEQAGAGGQYWKDCIQLLRQPYIKMLDSSVDAEGRFMWRDLLQRTEKALRRGRRFVDLPLLLRRTAQEMNAGENLENLERTCVLFTELCLANWSKADNLASLAEALEKLCALLLEKGEALWPRFPLDAECLGRFMRTLPPELRHSSLAGEKFPKPSLFAILRELIAAERVAFEAYPLTALQVIGLLESRLLHFKNVFILDATDDLLPGGRNNDPLLPDSLRPELGLPGQIRRRNMSAYYFFRLLQGADKVRIFWQEGVESKSLGDAKKLKSRFVEELLWSREQKLGHILQPEKMRPESMETAGHSAPPLLSDGPLHKIIGNARPLQMQNRLPESGPEARRRIKDLLSRPVSATMLNQYLNCPAAFYYKYLAGLRPLEEVREDEDPAAVGELFHRALREAFQPFLNRDLGRRELETAGLEKIFLKIMAEEAAIHELPADLRAMLELSGPRALGNFLREQPDLTRIKALELRLSAGLPLSSPQAEGFVCRLSGQLDRLDERTLEDGQSALLILDYKTGRIKSADPGLWRDAFFWSSLEEGRAPLDDKAFFQTLAERLPDVQLPLYLYLAAFGQVEEEAEPADFKPEAAHNAVWVDLGGNGGEIPLFPEAFSLEERKDIIENKVELLLDYLLGHMLHARDFAPVPGKLCPYCAFQALCQELA
jgi:hypothetical protein